MKRILWFRRDLRISDNPLLSFPGEVLPIFIFDTHILNKLAKNDRRVSYIFHQVIALKNGLKTLGLDLKIFFGDPVEIFRLLDQEGFDEVVASGDYDTYAKERDIKISMILPFQWIEDTYIFQPNEILKDDGTPYLVFTPFYHKAKILFTQAHLHTCSVAEHILLKSNYEVMTGVKNGVKTDLCLRVDSLEFEEVFYEIIPLKEKLNRLSNTLKEYTKHRDFPAIDGTSNLAVELRFGVLGIRELLRFLVAQKKEGIDTEPFFRQLIFRDFYAYVLYHFPHVSWKNYKYPFNGIEDKTKFELFCKGKTGFPIVDAGVRQLLETGEMHNRVRMVCASFFTKDLLLPWQWGEAFFAKHLFDYDAASNILSWQWSAGTGIDPQPYFRIFNPWLQSKKFDKDAIYIKKWLPELAILTSGQIHDENFMRTHMIDHYPHPIVIHKEASQKALSYFSQQLNPPKDI
jgi:deoxyribodipyrimidine photo-lyase